MYRQQNQHLWKKSKADSIIQAKKKWEKLTEEQKKPYMQDLKKINEEYIENFGRFLQVSAFLQRPRIIKKKKKKNPFPS